MEHCVRQVATMAFRPLARRWGVTKRCWEYFYIGSRPRSVISIPARGDSASNGYFILKTCVLMEEARGTPRASGSGFRGWLS